MIPLRELFTPVYGANLELVNLNVCSKHAQDSIRFVSRTEANNGVSAYVKKMNEVNPNPAHTISVAVSGSVLSSFYQDSEYYSGRDLYYLVPKRNMSTEEMIFYTVCIKANRYKYNYGRGANRTLKEILLPAEMPSNFKSLMIDKISIPKCEPIMMHWENELHHEKWNWFQIEELFEIKKGKRLTKDDMVFGKTPFIGSIASNNGYREYINRKPIHTGNTITVNYNGSVAEAFYQPKPFWASDDVNVLYPKFSMNVYNALFIASVIKLEKYRFNYGRKWHLVRMKGSLIKLPVDNGGQPDFEFMENYIKSLPYSASL
ncbi:MAG: restriction endonuclease subunit S [Ignavibacteriaceae bacterium]